MLQNFLQIGKTHRIFTNLVFVEKGQFVSTQVFFARRTYQSCSRCETAVEVSS